MRRSGWLATIMLWSVLTLANGLSYSMETEFTSYRGELYGVIDTQGRELLVKYEGPDRAEAERVCGKYPTGRCEVIADQDKVTYRAMFIRG